MKFNKGQAHLVNKWHELCRNRVIWLLNQWYCNAEGWLLLATLEEQEEAMAKLHDLLGSDAAAIGWNETLRFFGI